MSPRDFIRKEVKSLVFLNRSAEGCSGLHSGVSGIRHSAERIHCLEIAIAEIAENITMKAVGSAFGYDIHHAAGRPAKLRVVAIGDNLKFLNVLLRNG